MKVRVTKTGGAWARLTGREFIIVGDCPSFTGGVYVTADGSRHPNQFPQASLLEAVESAAEGRSAILLPGEYEVVS